MDLVQLVYVSRPFGFDQALLSAILWRARLNNTRDGITGALVARADIYLQLLEGPEAAVLRTWGKIRHDDRHVEVTRRVLRPVTARLFPHWAMHDDPAVTWAWDQDAVAAGAVERASEADLLAVFDRVRAAAGPAD
jgi:hypothetical protein